MATTPPPVFFFHDMIRRRPLHKRELRAAVFTYAPPVGDCANSQENDTVVTQTAQHELIKDHEAHDPAVNLLEHCNSAGWQFNPIVNVPGEKLHTRTIIARSLRRSKTNEIGPLTALANLRRRLR